MCEYIQENIYIIYVMDIHLPHTGQIQQRHCFFFFFRRFRGVWIGMAYVVFFIVKKCSKNQKKQQFSYRGCSYSGMQSSFLKGLYWNASYQKVGSEGEPHVNMYPGGDCFQGLYPALRFVPITLPRIDSSLVEKWCWKTGPFLSRPGEASSFQDVFPTLGDRNYEIACWFWRDPEKKPDFLLFSFQDIFWPSV